MLPLGLLNAAVGDPVLVELKDGDTYNGHLASCDTWMNIVLKEAVQTNEEGNKFFRLPEAYIRGNNIKFIRVANEIIEKVKEQQQKEQAMRNARSNDQHGGRGDSRGGRGGDRGGRGGRGGRGRGRGRAAS